MDLLNLEKISLETFQKLSSGNFSTILFSSPLMLWAFEMGRGIITLKLKPSCHTLFTPLFAALYFQSSYVRG